MNKIEQLYEEFKRMAELSNKNPVDPQFGLSWLNDFARRVLVEGLTLQAKLDAENPKAT